MQLLHAIARTRASFDDPNLVSHAGLVPLAALAERAGLHALAASLRPAGDAGASAALKVACLAAGMAAGADSIDDMGLLRHGAMEILFGGVRAPSTPGSFLRAFTWGNVSQLQKARRGLLVNLSRAAPLLPGAETLAFVDIDSTQKRVHGCQKQGAKFGHTKIQGKSLLVKGLNVLAGVISAPLSAPVIGAVRLRGLTSPAPVRTPHAARHTAPQTPAREPVDRPQNRQRQDKHARKRLVEASDPNRHTRHSTGGSRLSLNTASLVLVHFRLQRGIVLPLFLVEEQAEADSPVFVVFSDSEDEFCRTRGSVVVTAAARVTVEVDHTGCPGACLPCEYRQVAAKKPIA